VTLQNNLSQPSLVIYFFPTSPLKLKLELQRGGRPGPIQSFELHAQKKCSLLNFTDEYIQLLLVAPQLSISLKALGA
jgi:hypothetical protein